jgi:hypothetical protein
LKRFNAKRVSFGPVLWSLAAIYTIPELGSTLIAKEDPESYDATSSSSYIILPVLALNSIILIGPGENNDII